MSLPRNAAFVVAQALFSGVSLFVLYWYVARLLGPEAIGLWSIVLTGVSTTRLADLGLGAAIVRVVARDLEIGATAQITSLLVIGLACAAVVSAVFVALLWLASDRFLELALSDASQVAVAKQLIPVSLLSVWIAGVSSVLLGALDGLARLDIRARIVMLGSLVQLASTLVAVSFIGTIGLAVGHLAQSVVVAVIGGALVCVKYRRFGFSLVLRTRSIRELIGYGSNVQAAAIAQLVIDPATRALLSRFGGLELTGLFDMAVRLVVQARAVLVAGYQSVIPLVARIDARTDDNALLAIYVRSVQLLVVVGVPFFSVLVASLPAVSSVWLGQLNIAFVTFGVLVAVAWSINTLIVPAYYVYLGTGRLKWNVASQIATSLATVLFGLSLGELWGGYGVAFGLLGAMVIGSAIVLTAFHREYSIPYASIWPRANTMLIIGPVVGVAVCVLGVKASGPFWVSLTFVLPVLLGSASLIAVLTQDAGLRQLVGISRWPVKIV